MTDRSRCTA